MFQLIVVCLYIRFAPGYNHTNMRVYCARSFWLILNEPYLSMDPLTFWGFAWFLHHGNRLESVVDSLLPHFIWEKDTNARLAVVKLVKPLSNSRSTGRFFTDDNLPSPGLFPRLTYWDLIWFSSTPHSTVLITSSYYKLVSKKKTKSRVVGSRYCRLLLGDTDAGFVRPWSCSGYPYTLRMTIFQTKIHAGPQRIYPLTLFHYHV